MRRLFQPFLKHAKAGWASQVTGPTRPLAHLSPSCSTSFVKEPAKLSLASGQTFEGIGCGSPLSQGAISGEVVFTTSLVGYTESMTDPSYRGQILLAPLVDEYGLLRDFESDSIQVKGIIMNDVAYKYSHWKAVESLSDWCRRFGIPAMTNVDTRAIVSILREQGSTLGCLSHPDKQAVPFNDPNQHHLVAQVSVKERRVFNRESKGPVIALIDCGVKNNIIRLLIKQGAQVHVLPWNHDICQDSVRYDGVFISNGPGDPTTCQATVENISKIMSDSVYGIPSGNPIPIFGICMGNLLLGMAAGFKTHKLKYGNRGHNQPAIDLDTNKCVMTSQNHGYALDDTDDCVLSKGWKPYFRNANDLSNEGIRHLIYPYSSVQFHPEAKGGPRDTEYLFKEFIDQVMKCKMSRVVVTTGRRQESLVSLV